MVAEWFLGADLMDCTREKTGEPLKEVLLSKIFEVSEEARVADMVAMKMISRESFVTILVSELMK